MFKQKLRNSPLLIQTFIMKILVVLFGLSMVMVTHASNHLVHIQSSHDVATSADRFERIIKQKGLTVFNRIDHAKNAAGVDIKIPPSQVVIFGNPKVGTKLMQCQPTIAIDLPLKMMIWQDRQGKVWLSYYDPAYMQFNHQVTGCDAVFKKVSKVLSGLTTQAAN